MADSNESNGTKPSILSDNWQPTTKQPPTSVKIALIKWINRFAINHLTDTIIINTGSMKLFTQVTAKDVQQFKYARSTFIYSHSCFHLIVGSKCPHIFIPFFIQIFLTFPSWKWWIGYFVCRSIYVNGFALNKYICVLRLFAEAAQNIVFYLWQQSVVSSQQLVFCLRYYFVFVCKFKIRIPFVCCFVVVFLFLFRGFSLIPCNKLLTLTVERW